MVQNVELIASYWTLAGGGEPHTDREYSTFDFKDRVEAASKAGFKGVGIWHSDLDHILERRSLKEMKRILDDNGTKYVELEFLRDWFVDGELKKQSDIERKKLLEASQALNDPKEVVEVPAQIDRAAELQAKWGTAAGQAWQIGPHRLVCGDCRDEGTVGRLWREGRPKLRMVWTDPPYGVDYAAKNAFLNRSDRGNRIQAPIENDKLTAGETGTMFKQALAVARQFAEPGAACYATVPSGPLLFYFFQAFTAAGFTFHAQLTWVKHHFVIGMADYHHRYEPILYGWLPDAAHYFVDDRSQDDVFEVDKPHISDLHPTTKPVELVARMVANSSRRGETVYDPFCGSGTTLVACEQLGRTGYGVEIDQGYLAVAIQRLADLGLEPKLIDG